MKYAMAAILSSLLTGLLITNGFNNVVKEYTGATLAELATMKQECEAKLPRNKVCEVYLEYLPEKE